ncbi:type 4a pilus biogenesis protein PilO [Rubrobacter marinus]|uniref:Type 4a pilus biogenesis protein PilO n=1 Tax=Rubrobacter marinus TaxID=2653852 RepID=A0A6G8PXD6_9ACTN|nr:type 4a pilus biogenesis protein PilO [Rubrobacter marinus]QIN78863.1 type 4a pilus biogenesis protein PilO [Rubrobacter marinus]
MDRNDRNILIFGLLILLLLAVGYYFLLFSPLRQQYLAAYEERTQKEQQRAQLEQSVAELENVRRNAPQIERNILEYSKRLPEQEEIPTLIVQIEQIAEGAGATQLLITPEDPGAAGGGTAGGDAAAAPADGDFSRIPITMSFEGTYLEMQDFLFRLKNLSRLVTVNEVTFEELEEEGGSTTVAGAEEILTVEILAETYVQPASGSASPDAPAAPGGPTGGTTAAQGGTTAAGGTT